MCSLAPISGPDWMEEEREEWERARRERRTVPDIPVGGSILVEKAQ